MSESMWIERAQSAEAKVATLEQAYRPALDRVKEFKASFGVKEKSTGEIEIDFVKLVQNIGYEASLELKQIIDEEYEIKA